ncbi:RHS repeat-associated core domain-containing protein [Clostridium estertheticum]|nr:RHS repeat-associated core domain-containing protein [Clostridium estertheticum]MBZ9617861.1 RHS repeat-associated core domain-containing protein [Clostridium estertheticum subsp. laramiense]WAG73525.1 RHS repeat-associated core domain-containing protein [Clostridium estertheticum]
MNRLKDSSYDGRQESFTYDKVGNRLSKTTNDITDKYVYNVKNQLKESHQKSGTNHFTYDKQGNTIKEESNLGANTFEYNNLNQQVKAITKEGNTLVSRYDTEGLRSEIEENEKLTKFIFHKENILVETDKDYNPVSRFTRGYEVVAADIAEGDLGSNRYYYTQDEQGNTAHITDKEQQIAITKEGNTLVSRYDTEGLRCEIEENEKLTKFIFHKENILVETDKDYNCISRFTRGYEVVSADIANGELGSNRYYYTQDEQGSTVYITDKEQQIKNEYCYDAFGNVLESTEDIHNRITYTGQQFDGITNQYYLRARFYNSVIGRFTQEDVYRGDGLNLYSYCGNNPVAYYDPSGYSKRECPPSKTQAINENNGIEETGVIKNWKGETVKIPEGHRMSPRDPSISAEPIYKEGPFTSAQREAFLKGESGGTKLAPHHRHQLPVRDGGVIDELPGPGHPEGNIHTKGSPSRHPGKSIFNAEPKGNILRQSEIDTHWKSKGGRVIEKEPDKWYDPGPEYNLED